MGFAVHSPPLPCPPTVRLLPEPFRTTTAALPGAGAAAGGAVAGGPAGAAAGGGPGPQGPRAAAAPGGCRGRGASAAWPAARPPSGGLSHPAPSQNPPDSCRPTQLLRQQNSSANHLETAMCSRRLQLCLCRCSVCVGDRRGRCLVCCWRRDRHLRGRHTRRSASASGRTPQRCGAHTAAWPPAGILTSGAPTPARATGGTPQLSFCGCSGPTIA